MTNTECNIRGKFTHTHIQYNHTCTLRDGTASGSAQRSSTQEVRTRVDHSKERTAASTLVNTKGESSNLDLDEAPPAAATPMNINRIYALYRPPPKASATLISP